MQRKQVQKTTFYPLISIPLIKNPSKFYAFPFIGGLVKFFMIIPVSIELMALGIANIFVLFINSVAVLFTGKYWHIAYELNLGIINMNTKVLFFFYGITNTYPGFSLSDTPDFSLEIPYPHQPNRFFAIPLLGGLARIVLLIPYMIYVNVIQYATMIGSVIGSFIVLFTGTYPESIFELVKDLARLEQAILVYVSGISDTYPSFFISMHHKKVKIVLIIAAALCILGQNGYRQTQIQRQQKENSMYRYDGQISPYPHSQNTY